MNAATVSGPRSRIRLDQRICNRAICNLQSQRSRHSFFDGHEHFAVAAPDQDPRDAARLRSAAARAPASAAFDTGWPLTDRITSPWRSSAGRRPVRIDVGDDARPTGPTAAAAAAPSAASGCSSVRPKPSCALLLGRLLIAAGARRCGRCCSASRSSSSTVTLQRLLLLVAHHLHRHRRARLGRDDHLHAARRVRDRPAVELDDHVARLRCRPSPPRRPAATCATTAPGARLQAEVLEAVARHRRI